MQNSQILLLHFLYCFQVLIHLSIFSQTCSQNTKKGFGAGTRPTAASSVKVHYHGTLPDGTVFDSSLARGDPATFALGQVVPGFKEGLLKMHEGETAMLGIPPEMGYGMYVTK